MRVALPLVLFLLLPSPATAQDIDVGPFLQHVTPSEAWIVWEASGNGEVEWGEAQDLDQIASGDVVDGNIREAQLTGLNPATRYSYRLDAGDTGSDVFQFTTPPDDREAPFRFAAISDVQHDGSNPDKYDEVIHDGIIDFVSAEYGGDLDEELGFVLVAGDLVDNGWSQDQWRDEFFAPGQDLMAVVPFYPVLGNHEANTPYYFQYFHLFDNAAEGYEEHSWYFDRANVRVVGLDSNSVYANQNQLDWLSEVLDEACVDDDLDFVFVQLHHPYLSELWPPGEHNFTGDVVDLLDAFATTCGKPTAHLFGHTHGYSRGQSRDHMHVWVNVATAGGNIDYWDEYAQIDYEEFTVSQDEYGFVVVDVTAGTDPSFVLERIGRGDEYQTEDNVQRDEISIRRYNTAPVTPEPRIPADDDEVAPECVTLVASPFCDPDGDEHGATHWQLSTDCADFADPVFDRWVQHQNWFRETDTQAGDHLGDEVVGDLDPGTDYCWRVRQRDRSLAWSEWSPATPFRTGDSVLGDNLLVNPGAEDGDTGWSAVEGALEVLTDGECGGISPHAGDHYFAVGGVCEDGEYGEALQQVDVSAHADAIDAGEVAIRFGGMLSTWGGDDHPEVEVVFRDVDGNELGRTGRVGTFNSDWIEVAGYATVPTITRTLDLVLFGTRNAGQDNDSYFDDLHLYLDDSGALQGCIEPPPYPFEDEEVDCEGDAADDDSAGDDDDSVGDDDDTTVEPGDDDDGDGGCECDAGRRSGKCWWVLGIAFWAVARIWGRRA